MATVSGYCFEGYVQTSAALAEKRLLQQCETTRKMFKKIRRGKGRHLIALVEPHLINCKSCQAHFKRYDLNKILLEARAR